MHIDMCIYVHIDLYKLYIYTHVYKVYIYNISVYMYTLYKTPSA